MEITDPGLDVLTEQYNTQSRCTVQDTTAMGVSVKKKTPLQSQHLPNNTANTVINHVCCFLNLGNK